MKRYNRRTLIMNRDYTPINVKHWTSAITLIVKNKATQIDFYKDDEIKDGHGRIYTVPAVIVLNKYVRRDYRKAPFNKHNILARDKFCCQYCGLECKGQDLTLDHVIPRSKWKGKGTPTVWTNIVTACFQCNSKKADKSCDDSGMFPMKPPVQPAYDEIFFGLHFHGRIEKEWLTWLAAAFPSFREEAEKYEQANVH